MIFGKINARKVFPFNKLKENINQDIFDCENIVLSEYIPNFTYQYGIVAR